MRVLLTNDDGISAPGLQAARRALREIDGVELDVIAPDSNRSATARSITTRSPLTVEEVEFEDGDVGHATDGTPVDCVRFAELGLVGGRPDLIVSGINHGANLGDDITYSGTVAAAFEGIVLGIPAAAFSQQSSGGGMGYVSGRFEFGVAAAFTAELVRRLLSEPMPAATLINVNCPAGEPQGIEVTKLGKRIYNDELKLVGEESEGGRRRYEIYGWQPGYEEIDDVPLPAGTLLNVNCPAGDVQGVEVARLGKRIYRDELNVQQQEGARRLIRIYGDEPDYHHEAGTDMAAIAEGRISVTPLHFDLNDEPGLETLRAYDLARLLAPAAREVE